MNVFTRYRRPPLRAGKILRSIDRGVSEIHHEHVLESRV
jgi:hypothetical protein